MYLYPFYLNFFHFCTSFVAAPFYNIKVLFCIAIFTLHAFFFFVNWQTDAYDIIPLHYLIEMNLSRSSHYCRGIIIRSAACACLFINRAKDVNSHCCRCRYKQFNRYDGTANTAWYQTAKINWKRLLSKFELYIFRDACAHYFNKHNSIDKGEGTCFFIV